MWTWSSRYEPLALVCSSCSEIYFFFGWLCSNPYPSFACSTFVTCNPVMDWELYRMCHSSVWTRCINSILLSQKGFLNTSCGPINESEDEYNKEELDLPTDFKDLPTRIDWNTELPANIVVPKVDLHSLILDFAAVSFLDISALKGLKTVSCSFTATTEVVLSPRLISL